MDSGACWIFPFSIGDARDLAMDPRGRRGGVCCDAAGLLHGGGVLDLDVGLCARYAGGGCDGGAGRNIGAGFVLDTLVDDVGSGKDEGRGVACPSAEGARRDCLCDAAVRACLQSRRANHSGLTLGTGKAVPPSALGVEPRHGADEAGVDDRSKGPGFAGSR